MKAGSTNTTETPALNPKELDQSHRYLYQLVRDVMKENRRYRRGRRWSKLLWLLLIGLLLAAIWFAVFMADKMTPHIAEVEIKGVIADGSPASMAYVYPALEKAFENKASKAVLLTINSPGGSPIQSDRIFLAINKLKAAYPEKTVYAVCSEVCASGAYYIAAAADEIYAHNSSIVGSIGVIYSGFGFDQAMAKLGIDSRRQTAGENKGMLDSFSPVNPEHQAMLQTMLEAIHEQFIAAVKEGRGERLAADQYDTIFSGQFWHGGAGVELGLVDQLGAVEDVSTLLDLDIVDYTVGQTPIDQLIGASIQGVEAALLPSDQYSARRSGSGVNTILPLQ